MDYLSKLTQFMNYSVAKRETITHNIANQNTPNYKAQRVKWADTLSGADVSKTHEKHLPVSSKSDDFITVSDDSVEVKSDGNGVDMNKEIVEMMKNNHLYSTAIHALNNRSAMRNAARGN